jgi:hypothetical protein
MGLVKGKFLRALLAAGCVWGTAGLPGVSAALAPPPPGKFYQGFFFNASNPESDDENEHNVTAEDVRRFEQAVEKKTSWVYFSDNWCESRAFPAAMCGWISSLGKVPYVRLMLRSDLDQRHAEKLFSLKNILANHFDDDLKRWAKGARAFGRPLLIEWGTEPNGEWFAWNGKWHGHADGPPQYVAAYRHIVEVMREAGANNLQWVWHANWDDVPVTHWNRLENYFPGPDYCAWLALSAYGPLTPRTSEGLESFREEMDQVYPRLTKLAPGKPIIVAEFGCDIHHPKVTAAAWARAALQDLFSGRWPAVVGFCWWSEGWENDDIPAHNSDLMILHDAALTAAYREELRAHGDRIQETPLLRDRR